ncbi:hypothetical protein [Chryseobacterium sp. SIMBA_029]|uniref:hypothetical protein n=1 Tax=Chryseobacterium sp. SIMBA_029 TaxID=3085772 RepID=UPI003977F236
MRKIIIAALVATSALSFAKSEEPRLKIESPKQKEKVLIAKKTIQKVEMNSKKIVMVAKENIDPCVVAVVVPPPANMDALGACLKSLSNNF